MNLAYKILSAKLKSGELVAGQQIGIQIDQTLTQDSTGTMAYLQLEAMGIEHVAVEKAVAYIDHNMLQTGFENMDDHEFIRSVAKKHGITFSKPGNGVCHQLQLENFAKPGKTLVGSDSHTPTCGAMGMIAIGAGGLDVAVAMATGTYYLQCPSVVKVNLVGKKAKWASAKDVILYILQQLSVKGGVNKIIEYTGEGLKELSLTDRATICNMGAELGATTSVFPTDEITKEYLIQQGREEDYDRVLPTCEERFKTIKKYMDMEKVDKSNNVSKEEQKERTSNYLGLMKFYEEIKNLKKKFKINNDHDDHDER